MKKIKFIDGTEAVLVVRCKECKHWTPTYEYIRRCAEMGGMPTKPDDFCSYGVKKGADDE